MPPEIGSERDKLRPALRWSDSLQFILEQDKEISELKRQLKEVMGMRDVLLGDLVDIDANLAMSRDDLAWVDLAREKIRVIILSAKEK